MVTITSTLLACKQSKTINPMEDENVLLMHCLIDVNLSRIVPHDIPLFNEIIKNLFKPDESIQYDEVQPIDIDLLRTAFNDSCAGMHLQAIDGLFKKMLNIYDVLQFRAGLCLIGDPFSGKSTVIKLLVNVLQLLKNANDNSNYCTCKIGKECSTFVALSGLEWYILLKISLHPAFHPCRCNDRNFNHI